MINLLEVPMLLEEFDNCKTAVINPETFKENNDVLPKTCVSFFSKSIMKEFVSKFNPRVFSANITNATATYPVYIINYKGTDIAVYHSVVGAPACVANFEDIQVYGIKNLLLVGSCGCLDDKLEDCSIILPTAALRDEGTSYHYVKASDEIKLDKKSVACVESVIKGMGLHYHKGKTWTTDAVYRETKTKVERRKKQGAITVEMECSAMAAVCKFRKINFAQIFYGADSLAKEEYDPRSLIEENISEKGKMIPIALECAVAMDKEL